ncbi:MAG: class I SAM-dependent methyltransferase [Myxococcota bacterium]|nr:class I SAM-dependent methyltransferase [Myxococcota bacterium]
MSVRPQKTPSESREPLPPLAPTAPLFDHYQDAIATRRPPGPIVDLACGRGRHALVAAQRLGSVIAIDRNRAFLDELGQRSRPKGLRVARLQTDLETPFGIPLQAGSAGAILVFRYLHRPLAEAIEKLLAPGGWLLYETFTRAQADRASGPSRPEFLLRPDELRLMFPDLEVVHYAEKGEKEASTGQPHDAIAQLVARKPG